jgi:hypothetical protein
VYNDYTNEKSIVYESVRSLYEDKEKNIWVATNNNGLYRFNPRQEFLPILLIETGITGNMGVGSVLSFAPTSLGNIFDRCLGGRSCITTIKDFNVIPTNIKGIDDKLGPSVWDICQSADKNIIWLAAQPGVFKIDQQNHISTFYNPPILENRTVRQIAEINSVIFGLECRPLVYLNGRPRKEKEILIQDGQLLLLSP